jgi:hypothetical protein
MADVDEVVRLAESLGPDDRVSLIARLWKSLPQESWPRRTDDELVESHRQLAKGGIVRNESVPWPLVEQILADSVRSSRPKVYSAPRRFDLTTILVVTAGYAVLFGALKMIFSSLGETSGVAITIGGFVTAVGIGQAMLFGGRRPRTASIMVGAALCSIIMVGFSLWSTPRGMSGPMLPFIVVYGAIAGIIYGYLAGVLVGGVFLVADLFRRRFKRFSVDTANDAPAASPFDAS